MKLFCVPGTTFGMLFLCSKSQYGLCRILTHCLVHDHSIDQQQIQCMLQLPKLQDNTSYLTNPQYIAGLSVAGNLWLVGFLKNEPSLFSCLVIKDLI